MKLNQKKAVVLDLDGVLVDLMWMRKVIDAEYPARFNLECPEDLQKEIESMSLSETMTYFKKRFSLEDSLERIKEARVQMSTEKYKNEVLLKSGVRAFLDYINTNGIMAGIATSNGRVMMDVVLDSLDIRRCFRVVTMACEVAAGKPVPDIYLSVVDRLHVKPSDCMVSEDVPAGIWMGKNAGMTVFIVEDAFSQDMREEKRQLANHYIKGYYGLLDGAAGRETIIYL